MGLEFRESLFQISAKCAQTVEPGMVLNLQTGFQNLGDKKVYALLLADTLLTTATGVQILTPLSYSASEISYIFKDPTDTPAQPPKPRAAATTILPTKPRGEQPQSTDASRQLLQTKLFTTLQAKGINRFTDRGEGEEKVLEWKRFEAYRKEVQVPRQTAGMRVVVDRKSDCVVVPVNGGCMPLHVATIKTCSKTDEGN
jgi:nucleosome binding factor SPN SPT16 subunit